MMVTLIFLKKLLIVKIRILKKMNMGIVIVTMANKEIQKVLVGVINAPKIAPHMLNAYIQEFVNACMDI